MIGLYQFKVLTLNEQAKLLWNGAYLGKRVENELIVQLYSVSDFFAELYYHPFKNEIVRIRPFNSPDLLQPYLTGFDLVEKLNATD